MWLILGITSSIFLGVYDIFKKISLQNNAVIPVLFFATLTGAIIFLPFVLLSTLMPQFSQQFIWNIPQVDLYAHLLFFLKAIIVASSWILAYFALKNLPITIVTPIRASAPLWVLMGALTFFAEKLSPYQWLGLGITLTSYYAFALKGKKEGIHFEKNRWIFFIIGATLLGSVSALFDKYLTQHYHPLTLQAYFSQYLVIVLLPVLMLIWYPKRKKLTPFNWHYAIPLIGISLITADFLYFYALSFNDSLISIIATLRRGSVITSFALGGIIFKEEKNLKQKSIILIGILLGIALIMLGS